MKIKILKIIENYRKSMSEFSLESFEVGKVAHIFDLFFEKYS